MPQHLNNHSTQLEKNIINNNNKKTAKKFLLPGELNILLKFLICSLLVTFNTFRKVEVMRIDIRNNIKHVTIVP